MKKRYGVWGLVSFLFLGASAVNAAPPPISAFARLDQIQSPRLSRDGHNLVFITQSEGKQLAMTLRLDQAGSEPRIVLAGDKDGHFALSSCWWAKNTRVLCSYVGPIQERSYVMRISKLVAVNADGSDIKVLLQNSPITSGASQQDRVLDNLPDSKDSVLIEAPENLTQNAGGMAIYNRIYINNAVWELNIYNGRLSKVLPARELIQTYRSDQHGNVRLGIGRFEKSSVYYGRVLGKTEWRQLATVEPFSPLRALIPISVVPETNKAYAIGPNGDRNALWLIDLEDHEKPQLVFEHPIADVQDALVDENGNLMGVGYETDKAFITYTDSKLASLMDGLKSALPETTNRIVSVSHDRKKLVILSTSDREAGVYRLLDIDAKKMERLGSRYPELDSAQLPQMRTVEYAATDGTKIPGYLTVPVGVREKQLPLIVLPHGGPIARDEWRFDFLRLFLASRGYAVLQMNYRGSSGYGFNWQIAAHQDWGGLTYADIVDGTRWAISEGIADPKRVCIVGWSFGGYAALVGAQRNADLYKCSASIAGVSDLAELLGSELQFVGGRVVWDQIGGADPAKLKANSPARHAAEVQMPVLMIHGTLDAQAPYSQSVEMANALKKENKNYKFVTIKDADHNLWRESERTTLLTELEQFLQTNLGPGATAN